MFLFPWFQNQHNQTSSEKFIAKDINDVKIGINFQNPEWLNPEQNDFDQTYIKNRQRITCIKSQKWPPSELVYLFIFCSLPHADNKSNTKISDGN